MRAWWALLLTSAVLAAEPQTFVVAAGVEVYDDTGISPLHFAAADAQEVAGAFQAAGVPERNIQLLITGAAAREGLPTRSNLLRALQYAKEGARSGDSIVVFFSGHGMQKPEGAYLLPVDANHLLLADTALPLSLVAAALRGADAAHVLFVIDACRNDPDAGKAGSNAVLDESFAKGMRPQLAANDAGRAPHVATLLACEVGQRAWEMPGQEHGAFSWYLVQGLRGEAATDGQVTLTGLAAYVQREVPAWARRAGRQQVPRLDNPEGTDIVLAAPPKVAPPTVPGVPAPTGPAVEVLRREGTLEITTTLPLVKVELDGQPAGEVGAGRPLRVRRLVGAVQVRGAAPGCVPLEQPATVKQNQTTTVALDLPALPGLVVETTLADMTVEVDGVARGTAAPGRPVRVGLLPVGEHTVRTTCPGRAPAEQAVSLRAGQTATVRLDPLAFPTLTIEVEEEGVEVTLDGQAVGTLGPATPAVVRNLTPGEHRVVARRGGESQEQTVRLEPGQEHSATVWTTFRLPDYLAKWRDQMPRNLQYRIRAKDGMPQVLIPAGEFLMGSPPNEANREDDEGPQKRVRLSAYWMDVHEVTVAQYERFCQATDRQRPERPDWSKADHPVVNVSWDDANAYAEWVGGSLPTEAQWEKAARGGQENWPFVWGTDLSAAKTKANLGLGDPFEQTSPVGSFEPNGYGLFDLAGNVWEWCQDWYDEGWYAKMPATDPVYTTRRDARVYRGAGWGLDLPWNLRVAHRNWNAPGYWDNKLGFRCAGGAVAKAAQ